MYSRGGGGGEHEADSVGCKSGGGGGVASFPVLTATVGENEVLLVVFPVREGLTAKGLGMGLGSCLSLNLHPVQVVGREETRKASGGVTDLVRSRGSCKSKRNDRFKFHVKRLGKLYIRLTS